MFPEHLSSTTTRSRCRPSKTKSNNGSVDLVVLLFKNFDIAHSARVFFTQNSGRGHFRLENTCEVPRDERIGESVTESASVI